MVRWYAARKCVGRPEQVTNQVAALVRQHDLRTVLPLIRFEKRPRGQFFVFYAIESEALGRLPPQLEVLRGHPAIGMLFSRPGERDPQPFRLEEIRSMVTGEVSVQDYARRLRITALEAPSFIDPFPAGDELPLEEVEPAIERTDRFDRLLLWLSAVGGGRRQALVNACRALGLARDSTEAGRVMRRLRLLGHLETSADGERWSVAPAVLAAVEAGSGRHRFVLCGERDRWLLSALGHAGRVTHDLQGAGAGPARISVETDDPEQMQATLTAAGLVRPPLLSRSAAWLAAALPSIAAWQASLVALEGVRPESYRLRRYVGGGFEEVTFSSRTGLYELWPRVPVAGQPDRPVMTLLYDAGSGRWLRGDWYGLRYLATRCAGLEAPAHYDLLSGRLAVAAEARPPEIYERALVLCSGRLPVQRDGQLFYDDVPPDVLNALAAKLHLSLAED